MLYFFIIIIAMTCLCSCMSCDPEFEILSRREIDALRSYLRAWLGVGGSVRGIEIVHRARVRDVSLRSFTYSKTLFLTFGLEKILYFFIIIIAITRLCSCMRGGATEFEISSRREIDALRSCLRAWLAVGGSVRGIEVVHRARVRDVSSALSPIQKHRC